MPESPSKRQKVSDVPIAYNWIDGEFVRPSNDTFLDVTNPSTGEIIGKCALSSAEDVKLAVAKGEEAMKTWRLLTIKARAAIMLKFHALMIQCQDELADIVVKENGKNRTEALASVLKGNETVEYACSLPQLVQGRTLQVSRGITCQDLLREYTCELGGDFLTHALADVINELWLNADGYEVNPRYLQPQDDLYANQQRLEALAERTLDHIFSATSLFPYQVAKIYRWLEMQQHGLWALAVLNRVKIEERHD
ncbi:methylmalonate-semialdehyde dehydrogenase [Plasmopara halstedii]|uniref:Methylmalonate-semialdehyde dehydrogenase n=1 Tax=Plasmopara halstedii TaxID=4781 RepID=A0A0P1AX41_PLAHL|nr:methylmalonate-semialdehyde dehydrogenase [Plasmopara halstedii]CEG47007.1 methylmalonate-semialdehyde dehydrogenase [Plasmopara halstedii]|eukprot:XP_024583376.1 methylmalonate-semialdehyde dehydrogenase [Plasmopara halstedii]